MDLKAKALKELSAEVIAKVTGEVINDILTASESRNGEPLGPHTTIGDFKKLTGFQASNNILTEMTSAFIGRFLRFFCMKYGMIPPKDIMDILMQVVPEEEKAIEILKKQFTDKFGPVSEERIKELEEIGKVTLMKNQETLMEMLHPGEKHGPARA